MTKRPLLVGIPLMMPNKDIDEPLYSLWTKISPENNQRRYYAIRCQQNLFDHWEVIRHWGRIGQHGGTVRLASYGDYCEAKSHYDSACQHRLARHYTRQK